MDYTNITKKMASLYEILLISPNGFEGYSPREFPSKSRIND
jgi:hypothetical protein